MIAALAALALSGLARAQPADDQQPRRVAAYPLLSLGGDPEIAARLEAILRAEVARLEGVTLIECEALDAEAPLPASAAGSADEGEATRVCADDEACLAEQGRGCGVDQVVYGTVGTLGEAYVLDLKLVDVRARGATQRTTASLEGDQAVLIDGVRVAVTKLVAPEQFLGGLELRLERPGAEVFVDGERVGTTPLAPLDALTPGAHQLRIAIAGYEDFAQEITIYFARTTVVNVSLTGTVIEATVETTVVEAAPPPPAEEEPAAPAQQEQAPPWESPLFLGGAGLAGVGVVALLVSGVGWLLYGGALAGMAEEGVTGEGPSAGSVVVQDRERYDAYYDQARVTWNLGIFAGLGGIAALGAGAGLCLYSVYGPPAAE